ncbi:very short patch repair endonuclease [Crenobacter caeni]|uniref:Very short patch repair endonuclease n=1 Tax=Crenobacter caeni TaxID=2705474 RepID=A0A6B2KVK3_9NEIS|nr:very short patch repair endonuclease [Crenobacter caeni]NDV14276.1 DNA mismatch endonuclease Vsr [Crenobacter caeni]
MDRVSASKRSEIMRKVCQKDTSAELAVRKLLFALGYRYRLHDRRLPGTPDVVFPGRKKIIFVHGCFWHGHENCPKARLPKSNIEYWSTKVAKNILRDTQVQEELRQQGWGVLIVWQCQIKAQEELQGRLIAFLS